MLKEVIISLRPKQWYKNLIIFVGIIFSFNFFNLSLWQNVIYAFFIFCLLSGSVYIINDVIDREKDKKHPKKSKRPIASGKLKVSYALSFSFFLILVSLFSAYYFDIIFFYVSLSFLFANLVYSLFIKKIIIADVLTIAINFVIRAEAGCIAIHVPLSPWLTLCAFLLALFLAFGKRKHELILFNEKGIRHRNNIEQYSIDMLNQMISIVSSMLIVSYSIYTFFVSNFYMIFTIPVVTYAIFRYILLLESKKIGEETELIFKDKGMILSIILWMALSIIILYNFV